MLSTVEQDFADMAFELEQEKRNVYAHIREAKKIGVKFREIRANGGLWQLAIKQESYDLVQNIERFLRPA